MVPIDNTLRPDVLTAATAWALAQSGSRATTEAGRLRAVDRWIDVQRAISAWVDPNPAPASETRTEWLLRRYLDAQHTEALAEMTSECERRARWEVARTEAAHVPDYVRYHLYGADAPESIRREWRQVAGTWLSQTDYRAGLVADVAYTRAPWRGRFRRYRGRNANRAGIRREHNGEWSIYYADYTAIESRDRRHLWVRYPDRSEAEYAVTPAGTCRIEGVVVRRPETHSEPSAAF